MNRRGFGRVYLRGRIYWIRYWFRGRAFSESSGSDQEAVAYRLLKRRIKETGRPRFIGPSEERLTFEDLMEMLRTNYKTNGLRSARNLTYRIAHLTNQFALMRVVDISTDRIDAYIAQRQQTGATNATINRELAALKRAFSLGLKASRVSHAPHIAMLEENNVREGFLEHGEFLSLREELPDHLKDALTFLYLSGWRVSEMQSLEWRDIDFTAQVVRLRSEHSKNKEAREIPFRLLPELGEILARARDQRRLECRFVFHRDGKPLRDFRGSWFAPAPRPVSAKCWFTTSAAPPFATWFEPVCQSGSRWLTGHKTRSVFERYNIVSQSDKETALQKLASYLDSQPTAPTVVPLGGKGGAA